MFYTRTIASHGYFHRVHTKSLEEVTFEPNTIYWYDKNDFVPRGIAFGDFIDEVHWEHVRTDPTVKILMFNPDEYYNWYDVEMWCRAIKQHRINPEQFYIVVGDENWQAWLIKTMKHFGVEGFHICHFNLLMDRARIQPKGTGITSRFAMLSRNYQRWRLDFYGKLVKKDLLKHFQYTFSNLIPYADMPVFSHEQLIDDLTGMGHEVDTVLENWVRGVPYTFDTVAITEKFSDEVYRVIQTSGINVVIESHFDPHYFFPQLKHIKTTDLSIAFPTEKTYKAVASAKPFIMVSTPNFLSEFRQLGFKTFAPYIDESYDQIYDSQERFTALVNEIERLSKLSEHDFAAVLEKCQEVADYNLQVLIQRKHAMGLSDKFSFLKGLTDDSYHVILKDNPNRPL